MMHVELLKLALVVALCSNAILLGVLLVKTTGSVFGIIRYECCQQSIIVNGDSKKKKKNGFYGNEQLPDSKVGEMSLEFGSGDNSGIRKLLKRVPFQGISNPLSKSGMSNTSPFSTMDDDRKFLRLYQKYFGPKYSKTDGISKSDVKYFSRFHSQLKLMQQNRLLDVQKRFGAFMKDDSVESSVINSAKEYVLQNMHDNELSSSNKAPSEMNRLGSNPDSMSIRTKRSQRSDVEPENRNTNRNRTEAHNRVTKKPFLRRPGSFAARRARNGTANSKHPNHGKFRERGDRTFRRASRIAKRRMSKGKRFNFNNKRMRRVNEMKKIFSTLGDEEVYKMSDVVTNILLPSLVQFENLVGSHITGIRSAMVAQELRIEKLEKSVMEMAESKPTHDSLQNDEEDNLTDDGEEKIKEGAEEALVMPPNITIRVQVYGKEEGSGDEEDLDLEPVVDPSTTTTDNPTTFITTTTSPSTTPSAPSTTTLPPSTTTLPPSTTTQPPSTTTLPPSTTTLPPSTTTSSPPPTTTTTASTTITTTPPPTTTTTSTTTTPEPTTSTTTTTTPSPTTIATSTTTMSTTTTTTLKTTKPPQKDANYEELFQFYSSLHQKVDDIQNYNMLSSTELHRTQSMTIKMDDKVTELERMFKNIKTRDTRQLYRLSELEIENSRIGNSLQQTLKNFERIEERFDDFRDNMDKFENNVHKVNAQFARYDQISDELRSADAYKAHDILDIRESVMDVENRVNGLYRTLDEGNINIRYEMDDIVNRVCTINKLIC